MDERPRRVAGDFLRHLIEAVPYTVHTVLTDNGTHFTTPGNVASAASIIKEAIAAGETFRAHSFESACARNDIDHRLTKPRHPWTNRQVERMNRTNKDATVKRYHYDSHAQLRAHLADFVSAYNFGRRLKTLRGLTPYEAICKAWSAEPGRFRAQTLGQSAHGSGNRLPAQALDRLHPVPRRRAHLPLEQRRRTLHPSHRGGPPQLDLRRLGCGRASHGCPLHADRDRQAQSHRSPGLARRRTRAAPRPSLPAHRRSAAVELVPLSAPSDRRLSPRRDHDRGLHRLSITHIVGEVCLA